MPLCNAISARTGRRCRRAAMKGKDLCGIHAGKYKPGAKIYNRPNLKHGLYAEEAMQERMEALDALHLLKDTVETINSRLESAITYKKRGIKMFNSKMVKLDNLFSRNNLGEVRLENPDYPGVWKTDEQDYVTIRVPDSMKDRFKVFWQSAASVLGEKLKVLHVQENSPLSDGFYIKEMWHFIPTETAVGLLDQFDMILADTLPEVRFG